MNDDWWNGASARHLLNRAGFSGRPSEIVAFQETLLLLRGKIIMGKIIKSSVVNGLS
ncbi:MAG: hypothetical protein ACE5HI_18075 [bacterium]